jgi:hypothetical protein
MLFSVVVYDDVQIADDNSIFLSGYIASLRDLGILDDLFSNFIIKDFKFRMK